MVRAEEGRGQQMGVLREAIPAWRERWRRGRGGREWRERKVVRKRARRAVHREGEYRSCEEETSDSIGRNARYTNLVQDAGRVRREGEESHGAIEVVHLRRAPACSRLKRRSWRKILLDVFYRGRKGSCATQLDVGLEVDRKLERRLRRH